jgi:4-diphosphocytidyl-2-C-methyl-D-erythritol kinase
VITNQFTLPAYAKINWTLRVLGKRPDGYHEVHTILQTISLRDDLHFARVEGEEIALSCDDPQIPLDARNLILSAACALRSRFRIKTGARIHLEKRIPNKAGLGGASSNAAVALIGLVRLWGVDCDPFELIEISASLGADVPFFMIGGRAEGSGIGNKLASLPDSDRQHLLVIKPAVAVATVDAYAALHAPALTTNGVDSILSISCPEVDFNESDLRPLHEQLRNDFEAVIFDMAPEIERAKNALLQAGARGSLLAGSGSSVFGIFKNQEAQQCALREIPAEVGWCVLPCVTLTRAEYARALGLSDTPLLRSFNLAT